MRIAIVGSNPASWQKVPELGPSWEVWRFSRKNYNQPPLNYTRWFELHDPKHYPRYEVAVPGYVKFLKSDPRVMLPHLFPWQRLVAEFGHYFFSGGQAPWIMAYAITFKPDEIGLWGIDPMREYAPQRAEVQHFAQVARDRGIKVEAPEDDVLKPKPLYGLEVDTITTFLDRLGYDKERQDELFRNPPRHGDASNLAQWLSTLRPTLEAE